MKRAIGTILFVMYSIIAIVVTVLLLSYNEYNCSEIGGYTVYIVNDDSLEPQYEEGSILLIKETSDKNVQIGDEIFLYKVLNSQEYEFVSRTLEEKTQQGRQIVYEVSEEETYNNTYFVGRAEDTIVIEGWGFLLEFLESKWGYLFCIVVVSLLLFLQEVFELIIEIKYGNRAPKTTATATARASTSGTSTSGASTARVSTASTSNSTKTSATSRASTVAKKAAKAAQVNNTQQTGVKEEG